jgi:hypothetical protein
MIHPCASDKRETFHPLCARRRVGLPLLPSNLLCLPLVFVGLLPSLSEKSTERDDAGDEESYRCK